MLVFNATKYRSLSLEKNFSFSINCDLSATTGVANIGFSGDQGAQQLFNFNSGRVYDFNNNYIYSYNPEEIIAISGNIINNSINYFINNKPICLFAPFSSEYYKYFYVSSQNTILNLDFFVFGKNIPEYEIKFNQPIDLGFPVSGFIKNLNSDPEFQIQIFSGSFINQNFYRLTGFNNNFISGGQSGLLTLNYINLLNTDIFFQNENPLNAISGLLILNTNFGNTSQEIVLNVKNRSFYSLDFEEVLAQVLGITPNLTYDYMYEVFIRSTDSNNDISLKVQSFTGHNQEKVSGNFSCTGNLTGNLSSFIYGRDYITGILQGTLTSTTTDFYDNTLTTNLFVTGKDLIYATGNINYNYKILLTGGSGFGPVESSISIPASGTGFFNRNVFIFKERFLTGSGPILLSGVYQNTLQSQLKTSNFTGTGYFTGNFNLNYSLLNWSGEILNLNSTTYRDVYGMTGFSGYIFNNNNSGIINLPSNIVRSQTGLVILNRSIPFNSADEFLNSGFDLNQIQSSQDIDNAPYVFFPENPETNWTILNPPLNTGFIEFDFSPFDASLKLPVTHYLIDLNFENSNYQPFSISLLGRNTLVENFQVLDQKTEQNFYSSSERIFQVQNPNYYNYVRLVFSGSEWNHFDYSNPFIEPTIRFKKLYFFTTGGLFPNNGLRSIFNNVTGNTFVIQENNINYTGRILTAFQSPVETEKAWNAFNLENVARISGNNTGTYINIELPIALNTRLTGYYIKYQSGYQPFDVTIKASTNNISYTTLVPSWFLNNSRPRSLSEESGVINNTQTGFKFLNFDFSYNPTFPSTNIQSGQLYRSFNSGITLQPTGPDKRWTSISMAKNKSVLVGTALDDFVYISYNSGVSWAQKISIDKWRSSAISTDGSFIIVGADNKLYYSLNSGVSFNLLPQDVIRSSNDEDITEFIPKIIRMGERPSLEYSLLLLDSNTNTIFYNNLSVDEDDDDIADVWDTVFDYFTPSVFPNGNDSPQWSDISVRPNGAGFFACQSSGYIYYIDYIEAGDGSAIPYLDDEIRNWSSIDCSNISAVATEKGGNIYYSEPAEFFPGDWYDTFTWNAVPTSFDKRNWYSVKAFGNLGTGVFASASMDSIFVLPTFQNALQNYPLANWKDIAISSGGDLQLVHLDPLNDVRIEYIDIYTTGLNRQISNTNQIYGHGNVNTNITGFNFGELNNLTGQFLQSAVLVKTGNLQGIISEDDEGLASWVVNIQDTGSPGNVFSNYINSNVKATGVIEFINSTGSGLSPNDSIIIKTPFDTQFQFTYTNFLVTDGFSTLSGLISLVNNRTSSLLSGYLDNNKIFIVDRNNLGESGNLFSISRTANNINAIKIPNRYFQGGRTNRTLFNSWTGNFSFSGTINAENSGFYSVNSTIQTTTEISGVIWENSMKSWSVTTGGRTPGSPLLNTIRLNYNSGITGYSGMTTISSGRIIDLPSGFNFRIFRNNPNINLYQGEVLYVMNIANTTGQTIYSGILKG